MEKKLRILEVIDEFLPNINTAIRAVDNYSKNLMSESEITVATLSDKEDIYKYLPYNVIYSKSEKILLKTLKKMEFDIIHVHSIAKMCDITLKLKKLKNIPVVISLHKNYLDIISNQYTNRSTKHIKAFIKKLNQFDEIFVPSPYVAQDLRKYGLESKVSYMPLASDFESKVDITTLKRNANKEYGLNINDNVFVSVCNLNKFKRLDFALEALAYVKRKGIDFKYYIIGKGKELETLEELTKELHLTNCVEFLGFLEDEQMAKLLARANLMLFPTTSDIFGLCKVESAELETPGMFIKNSYVASDVFNGINGFTSNNTPKDYAQSIMEAIANKKKLKEVGETAKRELFVTWKTCADILKERLINIIKESKIIRKVKK